MAGFDVVGIDINPQPRYPFEFIQADAVKFLEEHGHEFDFIHASPPCQGYSKCKSLAMARNGGKYGRHPKLIAKVRALLKKSGKPYVIENVPGAPLRNPINLFGSQFGLLTQRQRCFESNCVLALPEMKRRKMQTPSAGNGVGPDGSISICGSGGVRGMRASEILAYWSKALGGVDWMIRSEMAECIPPAYTQFVGNQILKKIGGAQ